MSGRSISWDQWRYWEIHNVCNGYCEDLNLIFCRVTCHAKFSRNKGWVMQKLGMFPPPPPPRRSRKLFCNDDRPSVSNNWGLLYGHYISFTRLILTFEHGFLDIYIIVLPFHRCGWSNRIQSVCYLEVDVLQFIITTSKKCKYGSVTFFDHLPAHVIDNNNTDIPHGQWPWCGTME